MFKYKMRNMKHIYFELDSWFIISFGRNNWTLQGGK